MDKKINMYVPWLLLAVLLSVGLNGIGRQLWFDEALTIIEFASLPSLTDIYRQYNIPNNHILYTMMLSLWAEGCYALTGTMPDIFYRLPSLIFSAGSVAIICFCWKKRLGGTTAFAAALALTVSLPFILYALAVRGYAMSFFLILCAFEFAVRLNRGRMLYALWYFLAALAAVGTVPSNLLAFAALTLYLMPGKFRRLFSVSFILTAILPLIAFIVFYLPIWTKLMHNFDLKEGWHNHWHGAGVVYFAYAWSLLPLIIIALYGMGRIVRRHGVSMPLLWKLLPFMIPLPLVLLDVYPFPRVMLCLWPVWLYATARGVKYSLNLFATMKNRQIWIFKTTILLLSILLLWGALGQYSAHYVSRAMVCASGYNDHLFSPYYVEDYDPAGTEELTRNAPGKVFISFTADRYPLIFYAFTRGADHRRFIFNAGGTKVEKLKNGTIVILSKYDDAAEFAQSYNLSELRLIKEHGYHRIYMAVNN
jgi:hypothetical protein